jgi:hypothetical protein
MGDAARPLQHQKPSTPLNVKFYFYFYFTRGASAMPGGKAASKTSDITVSY